MRRDNIRVRVRQHTREAVREIHPRADEYRACRLGALQVAQDSEDSEGEAAASGVTCKYDLGWVDRRVMCFGRRVNEVKV